MNDFGAQKKVILGESALYPVDAIVEAVVSYTSELEIDTGEDYWAFHVWFSLTVSHANFSRGLRNFGSPVARVRTNQPRGERWAGGGAVRLSCWDPLENSKTIVAARKAVQAVFPKLQSFIIDEYAAGAVSRAKIVALFNELYKVPVAAKKALEKRPKKV